MPAISRADSIRQTASMDRVTSGLADPTDLHHGLLALGVRNPLHPLDRLLHRLDLPDPVAGEQLLGLGEWAVDHLALVARELDANAFRAGMKAFPGEHHARLDKLLVEGRHLLEHLPTRHLAGLAPFRPLDEHHHAHQCFLLSVGLVLPVRRAREAEIDTYAKRAPQRCEHSAPCPERSSTTRPAGSPVTFAAMSRVEVRAATRSTATMLSS